ncbi:hypothetical protein X943_003076 [Babesia divergens]|uniref:Uncharacterized protein n=1 Tax=Babesia divergens TaxID=32595 RepID=A0AAD9G7N5_BABDI|nr:hypothetical protein X943_003076 [Babesia divergens]
MYDRGSVLCVDIPNLWHLDKNKVEARLFCKNGCICLQQTYDFVMRELGMDTVTALRDAPTMTLAPYETSIQFAILDKKLLDYIHLNLCDP